MQMLLLPLGISARPMPAARRISGGLIHRWYLWQFCPQIEVHPARQREMNGGVRVKLTCWISNLHQRSGATGNDLAAEKSLQVYQAHRDAAAWPDASLAAKPEILNRSYSKQTVTTCRIALMVIAHFRRSHLVVELRHFAVTALHASAKYGLTFVRHHDRRRPQGYNGRDKVALYWGLGLEGQLEHR